MENFKKLATWTLGAVLLVSCAKEKEYDVVYKNPELENRNSFLTHETVTQKDGTTKSEPIKYLYVPMTLGTPKDVSDADPFYQGEEKVVRLEWSKEGLEVLEIERDDRFTDNDLNDVPVLTLPGTYLSYRCREDAYGDCTNNEESNSELEWYQKDHFKPNYEGLKVREVNLLDAVNVDGSSCVSKQATKLVDYTIEQGVINIELEKTYKVSNSWRCLARNYYTDNFKNNAFKVRFFYSLVRLDKLASSNYETINYPIPDHDHYGFFKREEKKLNDNFDSSRKDREILMERWNPVRKNNELVYHLSHSFSKPENKLLLDATHNAINLMNESMGKANVPFSIKLVEQPDKAKAVSPGDLRYNSLVLIEDPLANGLLGYGPAVSNPYTGEIVKAHTNMYGGVLKGMTRWVYEAAVDLSIDKKNEASPLPVIPTGAIKITKDALIESASLPATVVGQSLQAMPGTEAAPKTEVDAKRLAQLNNLMGHQHEKTEKIEIHSHAQELAHLYEERAAMQDSVNLERELLRLKEEGKLTKEQEAAYKEEIRLDRYAKNNAFAQEFFPIGGTSKVIYPDLLKIKGITNSDGTLKRFDTLNKWQKKQVQDIILVNSYTATLVHELGHNLGLRHNFLGSWDKKNFYTDEEAQALGMTQAPAYSSVMDYSFSEFNQMKTLGKYDLAALKFAYAREVELAGELNISADENGKKYVEVPNVYSNTGTAKYELVDDKTLKVTGSMDEMKENLSAANIELKTYEFCTDENTNLSARCNRFDEGTNLLEVAKFMIKRYKDYYKYRNFRDGRLRFTSYDIDGYIMARNFEFSKIRDIAEDYEFYFSYYEDAYAAQYGKGIGHQIINDGCTEQDLKESPEWCEQYHATRDSAKLVGDFFVDILKTPDHICALVDKNDPRTVVKLEKLSEIFDKVKNQKKLKNAFKTCFDPMVQEYLDQRSPVKNLMVIGENGKYLNSVRGVDPVHKYSSDRDVRGVWADKVMAVRALYKRSSIRPTTDDQHMSLMDIPYVAEKANNILQHYTLGTPMQNPLPFTTAEGYKFQIPYIVGGDKYKIDPLEDVFWWVKDFLGMNRNGKNNLVEIALKQIERISAYYGEDYREEAFSTRNFYAVKKYNEVIPQDRRIPGNVYYFDKKADTTYAASQDTTPIAFYLISTINNKQLLDSVDKKIIAKVAALRLNPQAPSELTDAQKAFFELDNRWHQSLVAYAQQGQALTVEAFIQTFGAEKGPLIFSVFEEGLGAMNNVIAIKLKIANVPAEDATEEEKSLYNIPANLLGDYLNGQINNELINYYKDQFKRLPWYKSYTNF